MNVLSANMQRLVLEAEVSISDLNKLENHLKSVHAIISREKDRKSTRLNSSHSDSSRMPSSA